MTTLITSCCVVRDESRPDKKTSKNAENKKLENAWWHAGAEVRDEKPYISKSGFVSHLIANMGFKDRTAQNKTEPGREDGYIIPLLISEEIASFEHGWKIVDDGWASVLMIRKY